VVVDCRDLYSGPCVAENQKASQRLRLCIRVVGSLIAYLRETRRVRYSRRELMNSVDVIMRAIENAIVAN